jgi:release factor glutamine methyltransferase
VTPAEQWTIATLLETAAGYLRSKGSSSPRLDAELLLAEILGLERIHLYTGFDRPLAAGEVDRFRALIARRAAHEPVAYILGRAHFRRLELEVGPAVLIPRPETEELVEAALDLLRRRPPWRERSSPACLIADVGTGSGAIALSLAQEGSYPVLATDIQAEALAVAARNGAAVGVEALVELKQTDLLAEVPDASLHLVVSNPPYVTSGDMATLAPDIRMFEPETALEGGPDGLAVIRCLLPEAARVLRPGGSLLLEVGDGQAEAVAGLAVAAGFCAVTVRKDMSRKERIVEATLPGVTVMVVADLDAADKAALVGALDAGAVIGVPTDTVYGLAARWDSRVGVAALFAAKGRPPEQPVAVLFPSVEAVKAALPDLESNAAKVMEALLPGPFTFVVTTTVPRPDLVGTVDSLGVRVPDRPELLGLMTALATPLAATSANRSGEKDVAGLADVDPAVLSYCSVAFAFMPGDQAVGAASTVVDLRPLASGGAPLILREGAVRGRELLERIAAL